MAIQILRLKDGSDIICDTDFKNAEMVELHYPMMFEMVHHKLMLQHWLPLAAMKGTSASIRLTEIVCIMEPNEEFCEYYETAVNKLNSVVEPNEEDDFNDIINAMDELENTKGIRSEEHTSELQSH